MLAWVERNHYLAGCIAGYSGGGGFQCEKFLKVGEDLHVEFEVDLSEVGDHSMISDAEDCVDKILYFHHEQDWVDSDTLRLKCKDMLGETTNCDDLISAGLTNVPVGLNELFEKVGLISRPSYFSD